jgi:hypothetical protein
VSRRARREAERSERVLKGMGKRRSCNKSMSSKCCEDEVISGQLTAYRSPIGKRGEETHLAEELVIVIVHKYTLDQLDGKRPVGVLKL